MARTDPSRRTGAADPGAAAGADTRPPYTIHDQVSLRRLKEYAVSADGSMAALRVESTRPGRNVRDSQLWVINADGTGLRRLAAAGRRVLNPAFARDGRSVYVLTGKPGQDRSIVRVPINGGAPEMVVSVPAEIESFVLSGDGTRVAFSAPVYPGPGPDTLTPSAARHRASTARAARGRIFDQLLIRHWDEWRDGRRRHIFVQPLSGGPPLDIMAGMDADSPVKPFGGVEQYSFTPDGREVVFTARDAGHEEAWSTDLDLFAAPVDASAPPRKVTTANRATDTDPAFSPDGRTLAYLAMERPGYEADRQTVIVTDWPSGAPRRVTDGWDRSVESVTWSTDGSRLFVTALDTARRPLFSIDPSSGAVEKIVGDGHVTLPSAVTGSVFYLKQSFESPPDLFVWRDGRESQITRLNERVLRRVELGKPEWFSFPGWNGETVHGYLVKPAGFDPSRKYPVAFIIHGGPQNSLSNEWSHRWNPQVYAGAGYAVVSIDFHGSTGYGQAFTDSIRGDWAGKPLEDLQKGYAHALERYPFLDSTRAAALGASYGGFMVNMIAGLWNEPWRCLVSHDGNLDERFAYFATEELWFPEWEHGGTPWENPEGYEKHNPFNHIAEWRVPMLVIHGALDYRVVDTEGIATFTALQRRGIPSRLLFFPDEGHWVLKPENSIQWHETVLEWLDRWVRD